MKPTIHLTQHAKVRARLRLSLGAKAARKDGAAAWETGIRETDCAGQLKRYLGQQSSDDSVAIAYREHCYIFGSDQSLITVYQLPHELVKIVRRCLEKREGKR